MTARLAIDIGGTFTDLALEQNGRRITTKVLTTPDAPERGVITGYTAIVDHGKLGFPLQAFSELRFDGTAGVDEIASIANEIPEVEAVYTTAGDPDALALLRVRDVEDLKRVVDLIRRKGAGTKTLMVVGTSARGPA